jgi:hypothetical protein
MYNETSVLGVTIAAASAGTVAFTGFDTMLWVWAAVALLVAGLLMLRWSAVVGTKQYGPPLELGSTPTTQGRHDRDR